MMLSPLLLLSAGASTRMGAPKGLLDFEGVPWLVRQLRAFRRAGGARAVVVLGFHRELYERAIPWLAQAQGAPVPIPAEGLELSCVHNPAHASGQFSSLQAGARALAGSPAFVLPVDVPCAAPEVWAALQLALDPRTDACVPETLGRGGHPVLLSRDALCSLLAIPHDSPEARLDMQLHRLRAVKRVAVRDPRIRLNLNTPDDLRQFALAQP
jgi:molybdenum cofactor cytidylyltransferase